MSDPDTGAPAPFTAPVLLVPPPRTSLEALFAAVKDMLPAAGLAVAVPLLVMHAMPAGNEKVMLTVVGALAGFLTGRASAAKSSNVGGAP